MIGKEGKFNDATDDTIRQDDENTASEAHRIPRDSNDDFHAGDKYI